jgi:hypothetical protein
VFQSADEGAVLELLPSQKRKEPKARVLAKTGCEAENKKKKKKKAFVFAKTPNKQKTRMKRERK